MFSFRNILFIVFCISFSAAAQDQNKEANIQRDVKIFLKQKSNKDHKKKIRKFIRFFRSDKISNLERVKIQSVLTNFENRKLGFNNYYVPFIAALLEFDDNDFSGKTLNYFLDFLILEKDVVTNLEMRTFLNKMNYFFNSYVLHYTDSFMWRCVGEFSLEFNQNKKPELHFINSELELFNNRDTIRIFNTSGYYDIFENIFHGTTGETSFSNDIFSIDFQIDNFSLNLNKTFFQIDNVDLSSSKTLYGSCVGIYKDKLNGSTNYPSFTSDFENHKFEIFEGMHIVGGLELKGDIAYFNNSGSAVNFYFNDDEMRYLVSSPHFQLSNSKLFCSGAQFSITNDVDSIYHPSVKVTYDNNQKKMMIDRLSGKRGLNPIRNTFHGLNMYADRMEIDLVYDECLFFHYSPATDISVLFESDSYFEKNRYNDLLKLDVNPGGLLLDFLGFGDVDNEYNFDNEYTIEAFSFFSGFDTKSTLSIVLDLEIFGLLTYDAFKGVFKVNPWATKFMESERNEYDYDGFKIESIVGIGDTVAKIDLYLNEMEIFKINKLNLCDRFLFTVVPRFNQLKFIGKKNFLLDGDIYIGNFAFSGQNLEFNYNDFNFYFGQNSLLLFVDNKSDNMSSSLIHFDDAVLSLDSLDNKSGVKKLNDFPKFKMNQSGYLTYLNNPVSFLIDPFEINYLQDLSLSNLTFSGGLYLDGLVDGLRGVLSFDKFNNLQTRIETMDTVSLYKDKIKFQGTLDLTSGGLFAAGNFISDDLLFTSDKIELRSAKILGFTQVLKNGNNLINSPFSANNVSLNYFPYESKFLIKTISDKIQLYSEFDFFGDLYFDGENLNGSGKFQSDYSLITSSHHYFSSDNIMSADASCVIYDPKKLNVPCFSATSVSVEQNLFADSLFISKSTIPFNLPLINYSIDFDFLFFDLKLKEMYFQNNQLSDEGVLSTSQYGKKGFSYNSLDAVYRLETNELCVGSVFPISLKKFWIQPNNNGFCILPSGKFPSFQNATLIKKRRLFKDKLYNNKDIRIETNLKLTIIND